MGAVYLAEHTTIERKAALKVLHKKYAERQEILQRFFNEARAANRIGHPSIVDVYDFGEDEEVGPFLIMEYLEGETLHKRLQREKKLDTAVAIRIAKRVASALGAAHAIGIVHRDLKPDNIYLVPDPDHPGERRVKILDFGIAKLATAMGEGTRLTKTGAFMGTPLYMSPEQCDGAKNVDHRSDIYSLGIILYEMLCGEAPFLARGAGAVMAMHIHQPPPPLRKRAPHVPAHVEQAIMKALAKEPGGRQSSTDALVAELEGGDSKPVAAETMAGPFAGGSSPVLVEPAGEASIHTAETHIAESGSELPIRTTLSASSGEVRSTATTAVPGRRNTGLYLGGGAIAVLAAVGLIWFVMGGLDTDNGSPSDIGASSETRHGADKGTRTTTAATAAAARVTLSVASEPAGAEVYRAFDGVRLGETPFDIELPRGPGDVVFVLRKGGFEDAEVKLSTSASATKSVVLAAAATAAPPETAATTTAGDKPPAKSGKGKKRGEKVRIVD